MIALVAMAETFVARHDARFTTHHAAAWKRTGESVGKAVPCQVVALGDSLVKHGVVPEVFTAASGRSAYNLAVPKGMFPAHDVLLRRLLRAGAKPEAVVVDGEMLNEPPYANVRVWSELLTWPEAAELATAGRGRNFFARYAVGRVLPTLKARYEVRESVLCALAYRDAPEPATVPILKRNWKKNRGAQVLADRNDPPGGDPRPAQLEKSDYQPKDWKLHPINARYVTRFLDRAQAHHIPVFWLLPPYHPEIERRRERYGLYPKYLAYVRKLAERYPNLTVIDGRGAGYPPGALFDMTHLSRFGALSYSDAVGRVVRDRLDRRAGGGWVKLPRFDPAEAVALATRWDVEDVVRSGDAMSRAAAARIALDAGADAARRRR